MRLERVAVVRNSVKRRQDMNLSGVPSVIEVDPRFARALRGATQRSHLWVLCWLHKADRRVLEAAPRKISASLGIRGVFSMRSPDRPNPLSLNCVRVVSIKGRRIRVDLLDMIDGTPVVDLKPYSPGTDCVPCATGPDYARKYSFMRDRSVRELFGLIVRRHCGRLGREGRLAVDLVLRYVRATGRAPERGARRMRSNLGVDGTAALAALFAMGPTSSDIRRVKDRKAPWLEVTSTSGKRWRS